MASHVEKYIMTYRDWINSFLIGGFLGAITLFSLGLAAFHQGELWSDYKVVIPGEFGESKILIFLGEYWFFLLPCIIGLIGFKVAVSLFIALGTARISRKEG